MKKIVFTVKLLAIIAVFPVYLAAELNRGTAGSQAKKKLPEIIEEKKIDNSNVQPELISGDKPMPLLMFGIAIH